MATTSVTGSATGKGTGVATGTETDEDERNSEKMSFIFNQYAHEIFTCHENYKFIFL
jgi:hypothetical protein